MVSKFGSIRMWLAVLVIAGAAAVSYAQRPGGPGGGTGPDGPGGFGPRVAQELGLGDSQKSQIQNYLKDSRSQLEVLRNDTTLSPEQRRTQAQSIRENTQARVKSVLTPDQQAKAEQLRAQAQLKMQDRRERAVDRRLERMTTQLSLSSAQAATVKSLGEQARSQAKVIRENSTLSQEQKIQQLQALRETTRNQIKSNLTADQQAKLDQLMQQARDRMQNRRDGQAGPDGQGRPRGPGGQGGPMGLSL